jgi:hypothetical protein
MKGSSTGFRAGRQQQVLAAHALPLAASGAMPPSAPVTSTVLPSRMRAQPRITCTPFFFSSAPTPPVRRLTMPSFQPTVRPMSMLGAAARMPSGESAGPRSGPALWNSSAAWISALDGMQPMFRQVPPSWRPRPARS